MIFFILLGSFYFFPFNWFIEKSNKRPRCKITVFNGMGNKNISFEKFDTGIYEIKGVLGKSVLEYNSEKGVRFIESTCPNQICVKSGWTKNPFSVTCVPNGVSCEVQNGRDSGFDGIAR
ncbi:MAG: NusG domain II-containing protein [Candidatus Riflebacteria bacterium]|nr:NusG domain II-containing protein [Candidatus Riflebacteria bacterium]